MLGKLKPFLGPIFTTVLVLIAVNKITFLRNLVYGTASA